jgi:hypothetical protein
LGLFDDLFDDGGTIMEFRTRLGAIAMLGGLALLGAGCSSISWSSDSISNSLDSLSKSSSESSPDGESDDAAYREDVKDLTMAHLNSGSDLEGLQRDLGSVALQHGVNDWESDPSTFVAVGQGLALTDASAERIDDFERRLAAGDVARIAAIRRGRDAARLR